MNFGHTGLQFMVHPNAPSLYYTTRLIYGMGLLGVIVLWITITPYMYDTLSACAS